MTDPTTLDGQTTSESTATFDAVVVGARCAGSSLALRLARGGWRVALVDKARFPSDTLSTHQVQTPGIARLRRWGLLDAVAATTPAVQRVRLDTGSHGVTAAYPAHDGVRALYGPRRTLLDALLVDGAPPVDGTLCPP